MRWHDLVARLARPQSSAPAVKTSKAGPVIAWSDIGQPKWTRCRYDTLADASFRKKRDRLSLHHVGDDDYRCGDLVVL